ncbi:ATP-binding protein [Eisenbergiella sp.]
MKLRSWCREAFGLQTIRKKVFLLSKLTGAVIVLFYLFTSELPVGDNMSFLIWFLLMIGVILLTDYLLGRYITRPVDELNRAAGRMAKLDFSKPCSIKSRDEFGELSGNLNTMAVNLQQALYQLEQINGKLEQANCRLEADVLQEKRRLEERRELADNLSHEMKTPLGIIRAYAEGLQDTGEEEKWRYAQVIIGETERMNRMLTELLELSAMEAGAVWLAQERIHFVEFTETEAGRLLMDLPDRDFLLEYELPDREYEIYADRAKLEQVLDNLIGNAKKHVTGGGTIRVTLTREENRLRFGIYNQGERLREEEMSHVWDKFYRAESDRTGGNGLGLAITAGILRMHGWEYGVHNMEQGVEFFFYLPTETEAKDI